MREIKFRCWDETNKIMHNEVEFIRSGTDGDDWILFKSDKQKLDCGNVLNNPYFQQQIKVMQYTGLKDKNGKEIYERDILNLNDSFIAEVSYCVDCYIAGLHSLSSYKDIKVIGNIYESPELLEN